MTDFVALRFYSQHIRQKNPEITTKTYIFLTLTIRKQYYDKNNHYTQR